jgi:uncharacterized protein
MAGRQPEERVRVRLSHQRWDSVTFLHWPFSPEVVQALLPDGLEVDRFDGRAWVGVTPLIMRRVRGPALPPIPVLSTFPETNTRTYVRGPDGRDGVWFFALDAARLAFASALRTTLGLPYFWADMHAERDDTDVRYRMRRRAPHRPRPASNVAVRIGGPLDGKVSARDDFLTGRWRAYGRLAGQLVTVPVEHEPWPLWQAEVRELRDELVTAAGLPRPSEPPIVCFSPGVDVKIGPPVPVRRPVG